MNERSQQPTLTTDASDYDNWCPECEHPRGACICEQYGPDDDIGKDDEPPEPDGECYRGGEYAASVAHEMAEARKLK